MDKLRSIILYILGFGIPVFSLPILFADAFLIPKFLLLLTGVLILLLLWAYRVFETNSLRWRKTPFDLQVLALGAAYFLSTLFASSNKIAAIASPAGSGTVFLLLLFYFLVVQTYNKTSGKSYTSLLAGITHVGILISLWILANLAIDLANFKFQISNFQFPLPNLSPLGSLLAQAVFLGILLIYRSYNFYISSQTKKLNFAVPIVPIILLTGLLATIYRLISSITPFPLLPYRFGWAIAVEAFKNAPVFGVGPENFISAFTRFKPMEINQTDYWNASFGLGSNWYLHILTTTGLLGLAAYLFLAYRSYKSYKSYISAESLTLAAIFILQLFVPSTLPLLFTQFAFLSVLGIALSTQSAAVRVVAVEEEIDISEDRIQQKETVEEYYEESKTDL